MLALLMCPTKVVQYAEHEADEPDGRTAAQWCTQLHGPPVSQIVPQQLLEQCPDMSRYAVPRPMPRSVPQRQSQSALQPESIPYGPQYGKVFASRIQIMLYNVNVVKDAIGEGAQHDMSA